MPNDRKTPRVPRLSDEARDEYPRKTPPAGVQAALDEGAEIRAVSVQTVPELGVPLHEILFEKTDVNNLGQLIVKSYARTRELSGLYKVQKERLDDVALKVDEVALQGSNTNGKVDAVLLGMQAQNVALSEIAKMRVGVTIKADEAAIDIGRQRAATDNELAKVSATSRWRIAVIVATGIFGTGGIAAIVAVALTKGC